MNESIQAVFVNPLGRFTETSLSNNNLQMNLQMNLQIINLQMIAFIKNTGHTHTVITAEILAGKIFLRSCCTYEGATDSEGFKVSLK